MPWIVELTFLKKDSSEIIYRKGDNGSSCLTPLSSEKDSEIISLSEIVVIWFSYILLIKMQKCVKKPKKKEKVQKR